MNTEQKTKLNAFHGAQIDLDIVDAACKKAMNEHVAFSNWFSGGEGTPRPLYPFMKKGDKAHATDKDRAELNRLDARWRELSAEVDRKMRIRDEAAVAFASVMLKHREEERANGR